MKVAPLAKVEVMMPVGAPPDETPGNFAELLQTAVVAPTTATSILVVPPPKAMLTGLAIHAVEAPQQPEKMSFAGNSDGLGLDPRATPSARVDDDAARATSRDPDVLEAAEVLQAPDAPTPIAAAMITVQPVTSSRIALPQTDVGDLVLLMRHDTEQVETETPRRREVAATLREAARPMPATIASAGPFTVLVAQPQPAAQAPDELPVGVKVGTHAALPMQASPDRALPDRASAIAAILYPIRQSAPSLGFGTATPAMAQDPATQAPTMPPTGFVTTAIEPELLVRATGIVLPVAATGDQPAVASARHTAIDNAAPRVDAALPASLLPPSPEPATRVVAQPLPQHPDDTPMLRRPPSRIAPLGIEIAPAPILSQQVNTPESSNAGALARANIPAAAAEAHVVETEALGDVAIAIDRRDTALHVHFTVDRSSTAQTLRDSARLLDGALQAGGTRLDQLSVDVRGGDARAAAGGDARAAAEGDARNGAAQSDSGGQRAPSRDPRHHDSPGSMRLRIPHVTTQDRFA